MTYTLARTAAPAAIFTAEEAKQHLRVDYDDDDLMIKSLIAAATEYLDGADGQLGRALMSQTWRMAFDAFSGPIMLPLPPCASVSSVAYVDGDGTTQTWASSNYRVTGIGSANGARIDPAYGLSWPSTRAVGEAVAVTFVCGYTDADSVPAPIKRAILSIIGDMYEVRETIGSNMFKVPTAAAVDDVIAAYRVRTF